jgi:hypothetical protein
MVAQTVASAAPSIVTPVRPAGGIFDVDSRLYTADLDGVRKTDITELMLSAVARYDWNADIKGTLNLQLRDVGATQAFKDLLIPTVSYAWRDQYNNLYTIDDEPLGLFYYDPPDRTADRMTVTSRITARDPLWMLSKLISDKMYWIETSEYYGDAVRRILSGKSRVQIDIPSTSTKPSKTKAVRPNANLLLFANDSMLSAQYWDLSADRHGLVSTFPQTPLSQSDPVRIIDSRLGDVIGDIDIVPDREQFCNLVYLASNNPTADVTMREGYQLQLTDPLDEFSIPNIGAYPREITDNRDESFDGMRQRAAIIMEEGYGMFRRFTFPVWPDPRFRPREVWQVYYEQDTGRVLANGKYRVESTAFGLTKNDFAQIVTISELATLNQVI